MRTPSLFSGLKKKNASGLLVVLLALSSSSFAANTEKQLHSFNGTWGSEPSGPLVFDAAGNIYGVAESGGTYGGGVAFMLSKNASGGWTESVLHNFGNSKVDDGKTPLLNLIFDSSGNLYGVTLSGGTHGVGTVYELSPGGGGKWTESVLYNFNGKIGSSSNDGADPEAGLVFDSPGNLYGTTTLGGNSQKGVAYELSPDAGGSWDETVIWEFGSGSDGANPNGVLIFDAAGNLYGTTENGGENNYGTAFELIFSGGAWTESILYEFGSTSNDGIYPLCSLAFGPDGYLYGTTTGGGTKGYGTVFKLSPPVEGVSEETILHNFEGGNYGFDPEEEQLIFDSSGNLYGTTFEGGAHGAGIVFELSSSPSGHWTEKLVHAFGVGSDGDAPFSGLTLDSAGNLYGTTLGGGGAGGYGLVYEITP